MDIANNYATRNPSKLRRDWGTQNTLGMTNPNPALNAKNPSNFVNAMRMNNVLRKIQHFYDTAVFPQQLTLPRQYATTSDGVRVVKLLSGREIDGVREDGVRVVVQENARQARFVISPLFSNKHDAHAWARQQMGAA